MAACSFTRCGFALLLLLLLLRPEHGAAPAAAHLPAHHWLLSSSGPGATHAAQELGTGAYVDQNLQQSIRVESPCASKAIEQVVEMQRVYVCCTAL
jgi:hypothetical protein